MSSCWPHSGWSAPSYLERLLRTEAFFLGVFFAAKAGDGGRRLFHHQRRCSPEVQMSTADPLYFISRASFCHTHKPTLTPAHKPTLTAPVSVARADMPIKKAWGVRGAIPGLGGISFAFSNSAALAVPRWGCVFVETCVLRHSYLQTLSCASLLPCV